MSSFIEMRIKQMYDSATKEGVRIKVTKLEGMNEFIVQYNGAEVFLDASATMGYLLAVLEAEHHMNPNVRNWAMIVTDQFRDELDNEEEV